MKKTLIGLLGSTVICVLFLAGCIDEHYGEDSNTIVTNLTGFMHGREHFRYVLRMAGMRKSVNIMSSG